MAGLPLGTRMMSTNFPSRADSILLALIAFMTLIARWDSHVNHSINADESQYAAQASYLIQAGKSPFETPIGPVHGNAIYGLFASVFGEYQFTPIRAAVTVISVACAMAVYAYARRIMTPPGALLAVMLIILWSLYFEGWSANREWFALPLGLFGIGSYASTFAPGNEKRWYRYVLAGLFSGLSVLPKDQALFFAIVPLIDIFLRGAHANDGVFLLRSGCYWLLGFLGAVMAYLLPFLGAGTLQEHLEFLWSFRINAYIASSIGGQPTALRMDTLAQYLYVSMPARRLFAAAFVVAILSLVSSLRHGTLMDAGSLLLHPRVRLASVYFLMAGVAVQVGNRFFLHYYLFWLPSVSVLAAVALAEVLRPTNTHPARSKWLLAATGLFLLDAWLVHEPIPWLHFPFWHLTLAVVGLAVGLATGSRRRLSIGAVTLATLLIGEFALLTVGTILHANQVVSRGVDRPRITALVTYLQENAEQGDTLFVWGWRPEIYTESRLSAATPFSTGMEIMRDTFGSPSRNPSPNNDYVEDLMHSLRDQPPRFIVDAWPISINGASYRLKFIPVLRSWLANHYDHVATLDGCNVYCWRGDSAPRNDRLELDNDLETVLAWMEKAAREHPYDFVCLLNQADALVQEGRTEEARSIYERIEKFTPHWPVIQDRLRACSR